MDIKNKPQLIEIKEEKIGQRLDNWLFNLAKGVPKSRIYRAIRKGEVRINKKRTKAEYKLKLADQVRIPPLHVSEKNVIPLIKPATIQWLLDRILYEDLQLLILNKPAGIAVHGGSKISFGIIDILRQANPKQSFELVHRLDKDTSGCLLIAKTSNCLRQLHEMLRNGKIKKEYLCLVKGKWHKLHNIVDLPLRKNNLVSGERIVQVDPHGKKAITEFQLLEATNLASLLRASLHTGRTHQIRVHLQQVKHPLAGDSKYGDRLFNKKMQSLGLTRLFLHAEKLKFRLPKAQKAITVSAPLAKELRECWNQLKSK